jgi:hypothetical protein
MHLLRSLMKFLDQWLSSVHSGYADKLLLDAGSRIEMQIAM